MTKRKIVIVLVAIGILAIGMALKNFMATPKERKKPKSGARIVTVFAERVALDEIAIQVSTTGTLEAKDRLELYSEVQGAMLPDGGRFKAGTTFGKGQTLISLRADDARARVVSQRSTFQRTVSTVLPDIRLDHPQAYDQWSDYLATIDPEASTPALPEVSSEQLQRFLTGKNIYSEYYSLRNAEIGLSRYRLTAPYAGVLVSAEVDPGTVVRAGQLLGVFVKPGVYEIKASADRRTIERLAVGQEVRLMTDGEERATYVGKISRINSSVDPATQMGDFYARVESTDLSEGQFMQVLVEAGALASAYEIDRSAIKDRRFVFVVVDGALRRREIEVLHTTDRTAVISGLKAGEQVLTKLPPTAFEGMKVSVYGEAQEETMTTDSTSAS